MPIATSKEPKNGYYTIYLKDDDSFKMPIVEGKAVKRDDNTIELFALVDGIKADPIPCKVALHAAKYKKYDWQSKKEIEVDPSETEAHVFKQLNDADFPRDGFSATLTWYATLQEYKKRLPLTNIDSLEVKDLPEIPAEEGKGSRQYSDAGQNEAKRLAAKKAFLIEEGTAFLDLYGFESKPTSIAGLFIELHTTKELHDIGQQFFEALLKF